MARHERFSPDVGNQTERIWTLMTDPGRQREPSGAKGACPFTECIGTVMTNFDHSTDEDMARRLESEEAWAAHCAVNFHARVWMDRGSRMWRSEPWRHHEPQPVHEAYSLADLMESVNNEWGWE